MIVRSAMVSTGEVAGPVTSYVKTKGPMWHCNKIVPNVFLTTFV